MITPTASQVTVREVLDRLDTDFASVSDAVENGEFALWVGSGISRQAPSLGGLISQGIEFIRARAMAPATAPTYMPALEEALGLAKIAPASVAANYTQPFASWPEHDAIVGVLWNDYSRVLDIRIEGEAIDFVLWNAIDIRQAFANPAPPAAEHLCIAMLVLEGAVQSIASANWDGFIEAAVERLSGGIAGVMQVVVDPNQLRSPAAQARLLKFHGCIVHATREPAVFRQYLTGSRPQIMDWPENADFAAMRHAIVDLATNRKTLVLGLSIQDNNLQTVFTRAKAIHAWPWPCAPSAPAHVFCEDIIQTGQRDVLRLVYDKAYNDNMTALHQATLLRAWGEKVLIALVLKLLTNKLTCLLNLGLNALGKGVMAASLAQALTDLRDSMADLAVAAPAGGNRTDVVNTGIALWSRLVSMFRNGALPAGTTYEKLSSMPPNLLGADQNAQAMKLGQLGLALALLQSGKAAGLWDLASPASNMLASGALAARAARPGAQLRPLFVVKSACEAIALQNQGAFANNNAIVIHADKTWDQMLGGKISPRRIRAPRGRSGHVGNTHVSLEKMLDRCPDAVTLNQDFVAEMML